MSKYKEAILFGGCIEEVGDFWFRYLDGNVNGRALFENENNNEENSIKWMNKETSDNYSNKMCVCM